MRPILSTLAVAACLLGACRAEEAAGDESTTAYVLELGYAAGQTSLWRSVRRVETSDRESTRTSVLEMIYEERVDAAGEQAGGEQAGGEQAGGEQAGGEQAGGGLTLVTTVRRVLMSETQGGETIFLDSAAREAGPPGLPPATKSQWAVLSALVDCPLGVSLDERGRVGSVISGVAELGVRLERALADETSGLTLAQAKAALAPAALLGDMRVHVEWLPSSEVTIGDPWTREQSMRLLGGMLEAHRTQTFVLESVERTAGELHALVSVRMDTEATSHIDSIQLRSSEGSGTLELNLGTGQLESIELGTETRIDLPGGGRTTHFTQRLAPATAADLQPAVADDR